MILEATDFGVADPAVRRVADEETGRHPLVYVTGAGCGHARLAERASGARRERLICSPRCGAALRRCAPAFTAGERRPARRNPRARFAPIDRRSRKPRACCSRGGSSAQARRGLLIVLRERRDYDLRGSLPTRQRSGVGHRGSGGSVAPSLPCECARDIEPEERRALPRARRRRACSRPCCGDRRWPRTAEQRRVRRARAGTPR